MSFCLYVVLTTLLTAALRYRSERNLTYAPHLLSFFIGFLLRNRVFPEQTYQRGLKRALETIQQAKKELPMTYKIGRIIPDQFSEACKEIFGRMGSVNWTTVTITEDQLRGMC